VSIRKRLAERKLGQWALAYSAGAWFTLQFVDVLGPRWGISDGLARTIDVMLVFGLVFTLVVAWYHGERGRQRMSGAELLILSGILFVAALLLRLLGGSDPIVVDDGSSSVAAEVASSTTRPTIAVLPFENQSEEADEEFFATGLHEDLLAQLTKIRSLDIKSRTSVLPYADSPKNMRTIGEELGAQYIVEGSVRREGSTIRMSVRLQEANDDSGLWGETFDRGLTVGNVLDLQRAIALQVAAQVGAEVLPRERAQLNVEAPENLAAYEAYLDGLSLQSIVELGGVSEAERIEAHRRAVDRLEEAISLEPEWAPPWAVLGRAFHFMASGPDVGGIGLNSAEFYQRSRAAIDTALRFDNLHGPAWNSLAFVLQRWERDFRGAEAAYERAAELGGLWGWGDGMLYTSWGRFEEGVAAFERAIFLNPIAATPRYRLGRTFACMGDHGRAIEQLKEAEARYGSPSGWLAYSYFKARRLEEGLSQLTRVRRAGTDDQMLPLLYALADSTSRAGTLLAQTVNAVPSADNVGLIAAAFVALGQKERALTYLERIAESDPRSLIDMQCTQEVRSLDGDDRYEAVLDAFGFPR
jgi:TolB-like protein